MNYVCPCLEVAFLTLSWVQASDCQCIMGTCTSIFHVVPSVNGNEIEYHGLLHYLLQLTEYNFIWSLYIRSLAGQVGE